VQCAGGCHYSPLLTIFQPVFGGEPLNKVIECNDTITFDYIFGAAMFLPIAAVQKVGLLNEEYFLFYEELDYTQRLKRQGYDIGWCKNSLVYHKGSASVGSVDEGDRDKRRLANYYENLSTLKYTANFYPYSLPLVMVLRFLGKSFALLSRRDFYLFAPLFKAYRDFMFKR
jgi:GT2 family glycosyltransferase